MLSTTYNITRTQMQNLINKMPEKKFSIPRNRLKVTNLIYNEMLAIANLSHRKNPQNNVHYIISHITEHCDDMKDRIYQAIGTEIAEGVISHHQISQIANDDDALKNKDLLSLYMSLRSFFLRAIVKSTRYEMPNEIEDEIGLMLTESLIKRFSVRSTEANANI